MQIIDRSYGPTKVEILTVICHLKFKWIKIFFGLNITEKLSHLSLFFQRWKHVFKRKYMYTVEQFPNTEK